MRNVIFGQSLKLGLLEPFGVLGNREVVNAVLNIAVHESLKIVYGVIDAVVGYSPLRIIVGADFSRAVAGLNHCLAP